MILKHGDMIAPGIVIYDNVIENSKELIDFAVASHEKWVESKINGDFFTGEINKEIRNTKVFDASATYPNDIKWFEVSQIIWRYGNQYGLDFDISFSNMEFAQLLHYPSGEGFYRPHIDSGPKMQRVFSAVLYLNDIEIGGETYFNYFDISVSPKEGRLVIFPANYIYKHEARPPLSDDKFALVTWFNPVIERITND